MKKKILIAIAGIAIIALTCLPFLFSSSAPEYSEIEARFKWLVEESGEINKVLFGEGLPTYERVYDPWLDMQEKMREHGLPLCACESGDPLTEFDMIGFTLQYEMSYTNVLNMLDLAGIPLRTAQRGENDPLIIGGGPCAYNPEPIADFFDIFYIGEGETVYKDLIEAYRRNRENGGSRKEFLEMAFSWGEPDGFVGKTYEESHKGESNYRNYYWSEKYQRGMHTKDDEMWFDLGYIVEYYNFEADGLRFSTSINFS